MDVDIPTDMDIFDTLRYRYIAMHIVGIEILTSTSSDQNYFYRKILPTHY